MYTCNVMTCTCHFLLCAQQLGITDELHQQTIMDCLDELCRPTSVSSPCVMAGIISGRGREGSLCEASSPLPMDTHRLPLVGFQWTIPTCQPGRDSAAILQLRIALPRLTASSPCLARRTYVNVSCLNYPYYM